VAGTAVDWALAERVAIRAAGSDPFHRSYHADSLHADFLELTTQAEAQVSEATGLTSLAGPARARVDDRGDWIRANIASFQRLLRPVTNRLEEKMGSGGLMAPVASRVAGAEVGALLGWMSGRVLGQYDLLVIEDENPDDQDIVYYVGPNVLALEKRYGFPPREFRLWLALHEVTHRMQFTGVPWLRPYFLSLVDDTLGSFDPDPKKMVESLKRAVAQARAGHNPLDEGGIVTILATPEQQKTIQRIGGLMSVLEGHGDLIMDRAATDRVPSAERFSSVLHDRRQATGVAKVVQKLVGLEAKLKQYQEGEKFLETLEEAGGDGIEILWRGPEYLPDLAEIRDPQRWLSRVSEATAQTA
jgi:coenzyme F420 biosynthesis associated uncharacterized protein